MADRDYSDNVRRNVSFLGDRARELASDEIDRSRQLDAKAAGIVAVAVALVGAAAAFAARFSDLPGGEGANSRGRSSCRWRCAAS